MMRSLFSGVSGLRIHQTKMDVIANNVSNVNTVGYKSSRVTFNEVFNQTLSGASGPNETRQRGGINPMQVGLGSGVASIDKLMTTGAAQRTDNPLDLMIQGDGFFVVGDITGQYFTRAGNFVEDERGHLTQNGLKLLGWDTVWDNAVKDFVIQRMTVRPLQITPEKEYLNPSATTQVNIIGNINPNTDRVVHRSMSFYDSVGTQYTMDVDLEFIRSTTAESEWQVSFPTLAIYPNGDRSRPHAVKPIPFFPIAFNTDGRLLSVDGNNTLVSRAISISPDAPLVPTATIGGTAGTVTGLINIDFSGLNQFVNENTNAMADNRDGNAPGRLVGLNVGSDGKITGRYSNGLVRLLGQIPLAMFKNPAGLEKMGNNLFTGTPNSGSFDGVGTVGVVQGGVLEMSNVDLSQEITRMIRAQRAFQFASRAISVADQMAGIANSIRQ